MSSFLSELPNDPNFLFYVAAAPFAALAAYFVLPYLANGSLLKYPGPFSAKFTRLYLAKQSRYGVRSMKVHEEHLKHGTSASRITAGRRGADALRSQELLCASDPMRVRKGLVTHSFFRDPNVLPARPVSIADPRALPIVYAHGNGSTKSGLSSFLPQEGRFTDLDAFADFYDAFVSIFRGLFNTRDRAEHTRKRKIVSHTFSPKSVREFEPYISGTVRTLLSKWDALADRAAKDGSGGVMKGYAVMELLDWLNALAFDIIGDLAFGSTFGMLERDAADIVAITQEDGTVIHSAFFPRENLEWRC